MFCLFASSGQAWLTAQDYGKDGLSITPTTFRAVSNLLLTRPDLNSPLLFRADILDDSTGELATPHQQERQLCARPQDESAADGYRGANITAYDIEGFRHTRTIIRRLIPRKPKVDRPLDQACFVYESQEHSNVSTHGEDQSQQSFLIIYKSLLGLEEQMPYYYPPVLALAYLYKPALSSEVSTGQTCSLSIHYLPMAHVPDENRLHRTMISLLDTFIRLANSFEAAPERLADPLSPARLKETIIPQHLVQNTYSRLKEMYAADLISRWVESTEPTKHVFEDLGIAAFLIELWKGMYRPSSAIGGEPIGQMSANETAKRDKEDKIPPFTSFIDLACGNGVLTYVLLSEGYPGSGFDARRRKTWSIFPPDIQSRLHEKICVPKPFLDVTPENILADFSIHDGVFDCGTFIISNHADELTVWTPILAALSVVADGESRPLPFLCIPCCSHALSGAKHRYTATSRSSESVLANEGRTEVNDSFHSHNDSDNDQEEMKTGDLKALRAKKQDHKASSGGKSSTYASLTWHTVKVAKELGNETDLTLMRIPSTRNIGIVGGRHGARFAGSGTPEDKATAAEAKAKIAEVVQRECQISGSIKAAADTWIARAVKAAERKWTRKGQLRRTAATQKREWIAGQIWPA